MNEWRLRPVFEDTDVAVLALESVQVLPSQAPHVCHLVATLAPEAIIVVRGGETQALDTRGTPISERELEARFEGAARAIRDAVSKSTPRA